MGRLRDLVLGSQAAAATPPRPLTQRHTFDSPGLLGHDPNETWAVNVSETTTAMLDVAYNCVTVIADAIAGADVGQWNGTQRIDPPSGFTLRPDPDITRRDFLWQFAANLSLYRAVYLEEATVSGQVVGVRLRCIGNVSRIGDDYYVNGSRITNRMRLVRASLWPTLGLDAQGVIGAAREVLAASMAAQAYGSDFWQTGGAPTLLIKTEQALTSDQADAIREEWDTKRAASPGSPAVLGAGADVKPLGVDLASGGSSETTDKQKASIARYFNMLPEIVNILDEGGPLHYTTEEQVMLRLVRITLQPYADVIGEALSAYLPGDYLLGDRIVLSLNRMLVPDMATRHQAYAVASGIAAGMQGQGWMSLDEVRAAEGLPPGVPAASVEALSGGA